MSVTIKLRKGTASEWSTNGSIILASGEPGYEVDTGRLKIGNGSTQWSALSYSSVVPTGFLAGSGISLNLGTNGSSITISASGLSSSNISDFDESVDDRVAQLLVAGTGVNLSYNDPSGTLTLNNLHTEINILSKEPQGFVNRTDSVLSFNDSTRTFTIAPTGVSYDIYIEGIKVRKTATETVVIGSGTALNYLHFDISTGLLSNKTTEFNFDTDVPIAYIHWNADINQSTFFGEERHGIRMDSVTHKWIHNTFGMQYISGLSISPSGLLGDGSSDLHAQVSIGNGTLYQEDIVINIVDGSNGDPFTQELTPFAYIPTYYHSGTTGQWVRDSATAFPVKYNGTRAQYNLYSGGTWTTPNVPNNRYFAMWIVATNDINDPILAIVGQREDSSLGSAENHNIWSDLNLANIPASEIKPLYRLIFVTNDSFTNTPKSSLQSILDLRLSVSSTINGVTQNDHGLLFGLGDDDHSQYLHINTARTVEANHTFTNGLTISSGLLSAASGNFTSSLQLNGTNVSVSGHTHISSNITDFTEAVQDVVGASGFLIGASGITISYSDASGTLTITGGGGGGATISNAGDNRILTSDGTSTGINGESNLTFNGTNLNISGNIVAKSGSFLEGSYGITIEPTTNSTNGFHYIKFQGNNVEGSIYASEDGEHIGFSGNDWRFSGTQVTISNQTTNTIASFDGNKNVVSLSTVTYPSLTELSYVKGVTSAIQTQLSAKQNTLTNPVTGTGVASHIAYWNSSSGIIADSGQLYWDATNNRLGIGTITPAAPLEVYGTSTVGASAATGIIKILGSSTNALIFGTLSNSPYACYIQSGGTDYYPLSLNPLGGRVGIATTNPTYTLHVVGSGYFNGFLDVDNIRVDGNTISSTNTNGNIVLAPSGTGDVQVDADTLRVGDSNSAATITTNGTGNLTVNTNGGTNSGSIVINQGSNGNIAITPNGTGEVDLSKVDIDGGSIDNTAIGATTASTGKFKQLYPTVISNGNVSGSVGTDVSTGQIFDMTLTGATTLSNPTNAVDGVTVRWRITQDGTGGHTVSLGSEFQIPSSASSPLPWSTAAGATDILAATYHAGRVKWDVVAFVPGY
jgi:hypothetical protein